MIIIILTFLREFKGHGESIILYAYNFFCYCGSNLNKKLTVVSDRSSP